MRALNPALLAHGPSSPLAAVLGFAFASAAMRGDRRFAVMGHS
jgi:hypothetical protein